MPKARSEPNTIFSTLVAGSIIVIVDAPEMAAETRARYGDLHILDLDSASLAEDHRLASHALMQTHLGKIPQKRPRMHFQIDCLFVGSDVDAPVLEDLYGYMHPGGVIIQGETSTTTHLPDPIWDIAIAKLKPDEKQYISNAAAAIPPGGTYVEIGTYKGGSAVIAAASNPDITVYAVDIWAGQNPVFEIFRRHTQFFPNIKPVRVSLDALEQGPEKIAEQSGKNIKDLEIDVLFIDGDHSMEGVIRDITIYGPYAKHICGHDAARGGDVNLAIERHYATGLGKVIRTVPVSALRWWANRFPFSGGGVTYQTGKALPAIESTSSIWEKVR